MAMIDKVEPTIASAENWAQPGSSRLRRTRLSESLRRLVSETAIDPDHLVLPLFVKEGRSIREKIEAMPGVFRYSPDELLRKELEEVTALGVKSVLLFGLPTKKDHTGSGAYDRNGIIQQTVGQIKRSYPDLLVICNVCMCEYTDHGHCGILDPRGSVSNDKTLEYLCKIAMSQVQAGADIVAPSAMMDNQVAALRAALDREGFENTAIMSYSSKYASAFYGPFREAAGSAPAFGDRAGYQMDPPNVREAIRETSIDIEQGADIIMVKPAMPYLDVVKTIREMFAHPLAAYQVSGEYSMIKAASANGWLSERKAIRESLVAIWRAGADILITLRSNILQKNGSANHQEHAEPE